jgi:hypothetical protein
MALRVGFVMKKRSVDPHSALLEALIKAYTARAKLFHNGIATSDIDLLIAEIDAIDPRGIRWDPSILGISEAAFDRVRTTGADPHQVFAHPALVAQRPHLIAYYRNLATISQKGMGQILFPTAKYERRSAEAVPLEDASLLCATLNRIISGVIESRQGYDVSLSRKAIFAEIGAQLQGSWANVVGQGASRAVEKVVSDHIAAKDLVLCYTSITG